MEEVATLATTLPERLMEVEVPIKTLWPPVTVKKELEEVREAKVLVPVPPLETAKVPVQPGMKVKVLAVVVEMLMVKLVSEEVAT